MEELFVASITTLDIIVIYTFLQVREGKLILVFWTAFLNIMLPLLGFLTGEFSSSIFTEWSTLLSSILLGLIGLHMLLHDESDKSPARNLHPMLIALAVSIDSFSVSVSLGMLHMNKMLFITASGLFSCVLSYIALHFKEKIGIKSGKGLSRIAGIALIAIAIFSWFS